MEYRIFRILKKRHISLVLGAAILLLSPLILTPAFAQEAGPPATSGPIIQVNTLWFLLDKYLIQYGRASKLAYPLVVTPSSIVTSLIFNALLISGAIFVGLMVYAGSRWLFSHGNEEEITKAKNLVLHTMIGLAIVLSAYTISFYILRAATGILFYSTSEVRSMNQYRSDEEAIEGVWENPFW